MGDLKGSPVFDAGKRS